MATVTKNAPLGTTGPRKGFDKEQFRKDRITAVIVLAILAAMMGLMIWLGSLGMATPDHLNDFWYMMP